MSAEYTIGIDEAGRGPLAGPVCAAAVILPKKYRIPFLNDSKKLSEAKREEAAAAIFEHALFWHVSWARADEIDKFNILQATLLAMERALSGISKKLTRAGIVPERTEVLIDGNALVSEKVLSAFYAARCEPEADAQYPCVMAASIIAKVLRDRLMCHYAKRYPHYSFEAHKGYGTKKHIAAIRHYGLSPIHRKSFKIKSL